MEASSYLIKSKSSNSAITTRSALRGRDSTRSNLQFQRNFIKKRGVYVENKATKTRITSPETNTKQERPVKPPPRPKAGKKKFLASVLTILSKSTAATQYPDVVDNKYLHKCNQKKTIRRPEIVKNTDYYDNNKKKKFRSKILNNSVGKDEEDQQIIVLKPQNEMAHTPSIFSESESINFSYLSSLVKNAQNYIEKEETEEYHIYNDVNNTLVKEILEGKHMKKDKKVRIEDPITAVGLTDIKTPGNENKGLYNFFVGLLENISMSDVPNNEKVQELSSNASSGKIPLQINESVANKLDIKCHSMNCAGRSSSPSPENHFYCFRDDDDMSRTDNFSTAPSTKERKPNRIKKPKKAQSFSFATKPQPKKTQKTESYSTNKKTTRKRKKQTLLNMFKEELKMDDNAFEEPQNLYEALKIIADNKRKCQKTIHFEEKMKRHRRDSGFPECMFKRPKVISPTKKKKTKKTVNEPIVKQPSEYRSYGRSIKTNGYLTDVSNGSEFSLKVFGYDYERPKMEKQVKEVVFTYHSTPPSSCHDLGSNDDEFDYTDSYFNTYGRDSTNDFELK